MLNDKEIIYKIKNTRLFTLKLKQELILDFDFLSDLQKINLLQALNTEKIIIKNFLSSLKNKEIIKFEEIKGNIEKIQNNNRKLKELKEKENDKLEIDNLLNNLELA